MEILLSLTILISAVFNSVLLPDEPGFVPFVGESMESSSDETDYVAHQDYEIAYVTARGGLLRRVAPNGTPIGKFPYGTQLKIVERTGIESEIIANGKKN